MKQTSHAYNLLALATIVPLFALAKLSQNIS